MGCSDNLRTSEEHDHLGLLNRLYRLRATCKHLSLAEFVAGDMEMLVFCYGDNEHDVHNDPSNEKLKRWVTRLEEISRRD